NAERLQAMPGVRASRSSASITTRPFRAQIPIEGRPGFAALLERIDNNGVQVVLVEDQTRFARDLKVYVLGLADLRPRGLITADGHQLISDKDEMTRRCWRSARCSLASRRSGS